MSVRLNSFINYNYDLFIIWNLYLHSFILFIFTVYQESSHKQPIQKLCIYTSSYKLYLKIIKTEPYKILFNFLTFK